MADGSDDSLESDFNASLSMWKGPITSLEQFEPISLDLHTASSIGNYDCVRIFINDDKVDLNAKNTGGWTALMYAAYIGHDNIVNLLLDASVDVNLANHKGLTPLMLAASCGNESVCYFLREAGANLEAKDKKGWTALLHSTCNGHQNLIKFLLDSGADINVMEPKYGFTPLMQAAFQGHEIIVQCLLQHGADTQLTSRIGETARSIAMKMNNIKIVSLLDNHEQPHGPLRADACLGSSDDECGRTAAKPHHKRFNINEGPEALSKMIVKPNNVPKGMVNFADQAGSRAGHRIQRSRTAPLKLETDHALAFEKTAIPKSAVNGSRQLKQLAVSSDESSGDELSGHSSSSVRKSSKYSQPSAVNASPMNKVASVSPLPPKYGKPKVLRELLQQHNLLKYEPLFAEQDIDLEVFLTLSDADLKEIGIKLFGPRRKMTNAITLWHKEHGGDGGVTGETSSMALEQLTAELQEKTWQLGQAYNQLTSYHTNMEHYHKELEHEKNLRGITEGYLVSGKTKLESILAENRDSRSHCTKALKSHGKVKTIQQILRKRHEENAELGVVPAHLQDTLALTDETTKAQVMKLASTNSSELWDALQGALAEASKSTAVAILNLDKTLNMALPGT